MRNSQIGKADYAYPCPTVPTTKKGMGVSIQREQVGEIMTVELQRTQEGKREWGKEGIVKDIMS